MMIIDIAILPTNIQNALRQNEQIMFMDKGRTLAKTTQKSPINKGFYDIEEMDKAINAPSVVVPKEVLTDFETFDKWIQSAFK